ncbi:HlyD family secretion protein [Desulfovibrio sp. JC022]|uniref:HlyD family secretion protein n=1 Tax=Desulfovibrio sp. JC022 TaxID=2593642 RepID=UPI0013D09550|nr:HlyD family secretion protein [Desulfovibrio sp. JC022]NDV23547.1 HlyD family secretion protein [Desulfovibrio sp. JC022]
MNRKTVFKLLFAALFLLFIYWVSTYFVAYTDDAYLETDIIRMAPRVKGHVLSVEVKDNQMVAKGELLAVIDPTPFQINLKSSNARLNQARSRLEMQNKNLEAAEALFKESQAALTLAATTEQRFRKLIKAKTVSRQAYDEKLEAYRKALDRHKETGAEVAEAKAAVVAQTHDTHHAQAQLDMAEYEMKHTRLYAPVYGFITALNIKPGDYAKIGQPIMAVVSDEDWRVVANYREQLVRHIKPGQHVTVHLDNYPWQLFDGEVQGIARGVSRSPVSKKLLPYVEPKTNWIRLSRRFPVRIHIKRPERIRLLSGSDARTIVVY